MCISSPTKLSRDKVGDATVEVVTVEVVTVEVVTVEVVTVEVVTVEVATRVSSVRKAMPTPLRTWQRQFLHRLTVWQSVAWCGGRWLSQ